MSNLYHDGQEVTVTDALGVRGRGVMKAHGAVSNIFLLRVEFPHAGRLCDGSVHTWTAGEEWVFGADEESDFGLTIEPHPFTEEAPVSGVDPRDGEIARLNAALKYEQDRSDRIGTHSPGCHAWGPRHYECAMAENARLRTALEPFAREAEAWPRLGDDDCLIFVTPDGEDCSPYDITVGDLRRAKAALSPAVEGEEK